MGVRSFRVLFFISFFVSVFSFSASADDLADLKSQVKMMQNQISTLLSRIEVLETEKSAGMVAPVEVEQRVSRLEEQMKKPLLSKLAKSAFNMKGFAQAYYRWEEHDSGEDTAEVLRARLIFYGDLVSDFDYKVQVDVAASTDILRDALIRYKKFSWANVSLGQMPVPFSYKNNESSAKLDTIINPLVTDNIAPVRDIGVMLDGKFLEKKIYYAAGVFNGSGQNIADNNENKDFIGRVIVSPFLGGSYDFLKGLSWGAGIQVGRQTLSGNYEGMRKRYQALMAYEQDKIKLVSEYVYQSRERAGSLNEEESEGWYLSGSYKITPKLKGVLMLEKYDPNMDISRDSQRIVTLGGAYSFTDNVRLDLNYRQIWEQDPNQDTNNEIIMQTQFSF